MCTVKIVMLSTLLSKGVKINYGQNVLIDYYCGKLNQQYHRQQIVHINLLPYLIDKRNTFSFNESDLQQSLCNRRVVNCS